MGCRRVSAASFTAGAVLPLVAILLPPALSACLSVRRRGRRPARDGVGERVARRRAEAARDLRLMVGGAIAMAVTFAIGYAFGTVTS